MKLKGVWGASLVLVAIAASSCGQEETAPPPDVTPASAHTTRQEVRSSNKVLILGSSVSGGLSSREAQAVQGLQPGWPIDVVTPAQWSAMTATQFMAYRAIIIGDAACQTGTTAFQAAIDNRATWGPIIDGDVAIIADNPSSNNTPQIVESALSFVLTNGPNLTGMYVALGCAYKNAAANTPVTLLEPFGSLSGTSMFKVQGMSTCADFEHMFQMSNNLISVNIADSDGLLVGGDGCAAKTVFNSYPDHTFSYVAVATSNGGVTIPSQKQFIDYYVDFPIETPYVGAPYILVRGAMPFSAGCGNFYGGSSTGEECDMGDGINGAPNDGSQQPWQTCSYSCHNNWCGDGHIDADFGEECDNGINNGRTGDANGNIGACSSFCKIPNIPSTNHPPTALCANRTVDAVNQCGMTADINNGSFDQDGDLVGCTSSPAGPYNIGTTSVTLTCLDQANNSASCTATVTVADKVLPIVSLVGGDESKECTKGGTYTDPGANATDNCGLVTLPQSSIAKTGTVSMGVPSLYSLTYQATDSAGNKSAIVTRKVTVSDTLAPVISMIGSTATVECASSYVDSGATATDQCDGTITTKVVKTSNVNTAAVGTYQVRYNVSDVANHPATEQVRTVNVLDRTRPTVSYLGTSPHAVECGSGPYPDPGATATDTCAGPLPWAVNTSNINMGVPGTYGISYKATDPSGNVGTSSTRTVNVNDTLAPTLTLLGQANMAQECAVAFTDPGATAADQCYGNLTSAIVKGGSVNNMAMGTYTLTYNVKDPKNNAAPQVTRNVTVSDTQPPAITVNGPLSQNVECGSAYSDPGASATDACAGAVAVTVNGPANPNAPGNYDVSYSATDPSNNTATSSSHRTVTVSDTLPPTLTLLGASPSTIECGSTYADPGASASDQCAGNLTASISKTGSVNAQLPGPYSLHYTVSDGSGHSVAADRTVTVQDTQAPAVTVLGQTSIALECGGSYTDPGATASDACAGTIAAVPTSSPNPNVPNTYTINYTATDPSGNVGTSSTSRTVTVSDTLPPTISLNGQATVAQECGSPFTDPGATANDQCAGTLPVTVAGGVNIQVPASYPLTYSANDGHGHTATTNRTVNVADTQPPAITVLGATDQTYACGSTYVDPGATASDACDGNLTSAIVATPSGDTSQPSTFTVTYSVTDNAGHQVTSPTQRTVHVNDNDPPTLALLGATTMGIECADPFTDPGATATDACFGDVTSRIQKTGAVNNNAPGSYTLNYTVTDPAGQTAGPLSRSVTVSDTKKPVVTVLGQTTVAVECGGSYTDPGATANDQCAGALPVTVTGSVNNMAPAAYQLHYTATDPASHVVSTDRTVTVSDTQPPLITVNGPLNDTFACGSTYVDPGATANDACAGSRPVATSTSGNPNQPGQIIYTYSASDPSGNTVTSPTQRTVTVNDNDPPTLALLGSSTMGLECGSPFTDPGATANDACFGDVSSRITKTGSVNSGAPASYQITYNVTDPAGQAAPPVYRTVNVTDTQAPAITVLGPLSQNVQCGSDPYADPGATANDSCAGDLTAAIQKTGSVNSGAAGSYTISYRVSDPSGNSVTSADVRTVTVVDDLAPTLTLVGSANEGLECGTPFADPGATANDACAGDLTAQISKTGSVNHQVPAVYTVRYSVADPSNHTASADRTVTVSDTLPPTLTLNGDATQSVECGGPYTDPGATATDVCAGNLDAAVQVSGAVNPAAVGNYNVSYTVSDNAGHAAPAVTRAVQVRDTLVPAITVNGPTDQNFECGSAYVDPGATASDQCAGNLTASIVATRSGSTSTPGNFTITYSVTDPSGNSVTAPTVRTVHVNDNAAPTLALNGDAVQVLECGSPYVDPGATANDACVGDLTGSIVRSGSVNSGAPNDYTLIYNVSDTSGNPAPSVSRTVQVRDTQAPSIAVTGSLNTTYECGTTYVDPGATATDACAGNLTAAIVATQTPVPNQPANFTVSYSVTDPSGNTTVSATQRTVTMNDNLPPSITLNGSANQTLECSQGTYTDPGATATDACVGNVPVQVTGSVNMHVKGDYLLSYSARDTVGNTSPTVTRNVHINDSTPPTITLNGDIALTLECKSGPYVDPGATADDICSGAAPVVVDASGVNTNAVGQYLVRFSATDASGNTNSGIVVRNVGVVDTTPPTLTLNGANPIDLECGTPYVDPGATAVDACQPTAQVFLDFNGVNNKQLGFQDDVIRYRADDGRGNSTTATRDVNVNDTTPPAISLTGSANVQIECGTPPDLGVKATDLCFGDLTSSIVATPATLPRAPGDYAVSYSVTDPKGNTATAQNLRHFTVVDTTLPVLTVNGSTDIYYECTGHAIGNVWQNPGATATDSCQGDLQVHQYNTGDDDGDGIPGDIDPDDFGPGPTTEVEGLYYVQYLAWDDSYNIQGAILSVYVQDTLKPMLMVNPSPLTGQVNLQTQCFLPTDDPTDSDTNVEIDPDPYIEYGATGDDQCYGDVSPSVIVSGQVNKQSPGVYSVFYDVRDGAFNWADTVSRSVEVIDNLAPKLTKNPPIKVFPADNNMRTVRLDECSIAWDLCEGYMDIMTKAYDLQITSNDPANDGSDIVVVNNSTFQVRAKRTSTNQMRVYTATYKVDDASLNTTTGTCKVYVPVNTNDPAPTSASSDVMAGR